MTTWEKLSRAVGLVTPAGDEPDMRDLKSKLTVRGVNARGWRLYSDHGDAMFTPFDRWWSRLSPDASATQALAWLCILQGCEMDVLPPVDLVRSIPDWNLPGGQIAAIAPMFLRAAWKATVAASYDDAKGSPKEFVAKQVVPFASWYFTSGVYQSTAPEKFKSGWMGIQSLRRQFIQHQASELSQADWPPVIYKYSSGPYELRGLISEADLKQEGEAMDHCVGSYADTCRFEPVRIFSIRHKKTGDRVATLSVRESEPGYWTADQLKGPSNADPSPLLWPEIDGLLQLLNGVSRNDPKLRQYLNTVHQLGSS